MCLPVPASNRTAGVTFLRQVARRLSARISGIEPSEQDSVSVQTSYHVFARSLRKAP